MERLIIIELIPYQNFREKIALTKKYSHCKIEILNNYIYVERWIYE